MGRDRSTAAPSNQEVLDAYGVLDVSGVGFAGWAGEGVTAGGGALITGGVAGTTAAAGGFTGPGAIVDGWAGTVALTSAPELEASVAVERDRWLTTVWRALATRCVTGVGAADWVTGGVASMVLAAAWTGVGAAETGGAAATGEGGGVVSAVVVVVDWLVVVVASEPLSLSITAAPAARMRTAATGMPIISAVLFDRRAVRRERAGLPTIMGASVTGSTPVLATGSWFEVK